MPFIKQLTDQEVRATEEFIIINNKNHIYRAENAECRVCINEARQELMNEQGLKNLAKNKPYPKSDTEVYSNMLDRDPNLNLKDVAKKMNDWEIVMQVPNEVIESLLPTKKDNTMDMYDNDVEAALDEVILARKTAERVAAFDSYGDDIYPDGTVLRFSKRFSPDDKEYLYAALKIGNMWYTTGGKNNVEYTWDEFRKWLSKPVPVHKDELRPGHFE